MKQNTETKTVFKNQYLKTLQAGGFLSGFDFSSLVLFMVESFLTKPTVFIFRENDDVFTFYDTFLTNSDESVFCYPNKTDIEHVPGFISENERYRQETINRGTEVKSFFVFSGTLALKRNIKDDRIKKNNTLTIKKGDALDREELISFLVDRGYEQEDSVFSPNSFSIRGDIVDVFPVYFKNPFRCSFSFGEIDRLAFFDPTSQISIKKTDQIVLRGTGSQGSVFINLREHLGVSDVFFVSRKDENFSISKTKKTTSGFNLNVKTFKSFGNSTEERFFSASLFIKKNKPRSFFVSGEKPRQLSQPHLSLKAVVPFSFYIKREGLFVLSGLDIKNKPRVFKHRWTPKKTTSPELLTLQDISEINTGDFIVHKKFGIGVYRGLELKKTGETQQETIKIEYNDNAMVNVSVDNINLVHRHLGSGASPKVSTLGSKRWALEIKKARKSIELVAKELIGLYAKKVSHRGFLYNEDISLEKELKKSFPFVETPDQERSIKEALNDLKKNKPADRLICGDVGFGKTEVALRIIMRAVVSGRSSIVLCPTTILADQHFITCKERFDSLGVRVGLLSRFKTKSEQKAILIDCSEKKIDVLVGTHRVLSEDVFLPSLGVLIIDEEHKFGVKHKEKIRKLRKKLDVFTLSATPIPRTLQHSMVGIRDISKIQTPPIARKPITTNIEYFNWISIKKHIQKELKNGGQVYFVQNEIPTLSFATNKIKKMFPSYVVSFIHGQMPSRDLEERVLSFFNGGIDVLVCTTIIESGLDITNANLMIINNSQNFGLSQLYQMRGRVGRGDRQARCVLLIPQKKLSNQAYRRLKTIEKHTTLGSGYDISIKDLEIRGAGSLFGYKQSGHIGSVGFEMYCQLLKEEIEKTKKTEEEIETDVVFLESAYIPEKYIKVKKQRIGFYNRLSQTENIKKLNIIKKELSDRFGLIPNQTENLISKFFLCLMFKKTSVEKIIVSKKNIDFLFRDVFPFSSPEKLISSLKLWAKKQGVSFSFRVTKNEKLTFCVSCYDTNYAVNLAKNLCHLIKKTI